MTQERLTVRKIREVLRLKYESGLSDRAISGACHISNSTVGEYLRRAKTAGLGWPLVELSEEELHAKLFPVSAPGPENSRPLPDWSAVRQELRQKGVTLRLVWIEYIEQQPDGYQYSQYCEYCRRWKKAQILPSMHQEHIGGERMQVDYAGVKVPYTNRATDEPCEASVFVAVLPASNYTYAEAQAHQDQCNWTNGHIRALDFFGGVVRIVVPDNLKTGVQKPNYYEPDINLAYQALAEHYQFAVLPARVRKPKDKAKVEQAKSALAKDSSVLNWSKVAKKYSTDPTSKGNGGLRPGLTNGLIEEPLNSAIFSAPQVVVVVPDECQSNPSTHENAWNQNGSEIRFKNSSCPYS